MKTKELITTSVATLILVWITFYLYGLREKVEPYNVNSVTTQVTKGFNYDEGNIQVPDGTEVEVIGHLDKATIVSLPNGDQIEVHPSRLDTKNSKAERVAERYNLKKIPVVYVDHTTMDSLVGQPIETFIEKFGIPVKVLKGRYSFPYVFILDQTRRREGIDLIVNENGIIEEIEVPEKNIYGYHWFSAIPGYHWFIRTTLYHNLSISAFNVILVFVWMFLWLVSIRGWCHLIPFIQDNYGLELMIQIIMWTVYAIVAYFNILLDLEISRSWWLLSIVYILIFTYGFIYWSQSFSDMTLHKCPSCSRVGTYHTKRRNLGTTRAEKAQIDGLSGIYSMNGVRFWRPNKHLTFFHNYVDESECSACGYSNEEYGYDTKEVVTKDKCPFCGAELIMTHHEINSSDYTTSRRRNEATADLNDLDVKGRYLNGDLDVAGPMRTTTDTTETTNYSILMGEKCSKCSFSWGPHLFRGSFSHYNSHTSLQKGSGTMKSGTRLG